MCCKTVFYSLDDFIFRLLPAFLLSPILASALSLYRTRCACARKETCDKVCKRMTALVDWCRKVAGIPLLRSIPMHRFFHLGTGADDPWRSAVLSH